MTRLRAGMSVINLHDHAEAAAERCLTAALNVLLVYWLGQLAFPSLGLVPPTILGAAGITGLALILRRPITLREDGE